SRRRHTRSYGDWSSDVCSSDLVPRPGTLHLCGSGASRRNLACAKFRCACLVAMLALFQMKAHPNLPPLAGVCSMEAAMKPGLSRSEERRVGTGGGSRRVLDVS